MPNAVYQVIHRDDGGFSVTIKRSGALPQIATGFATEADAAAWIIQDRKLSQAADPFRTPAVRRWRGF